MYNRFPSPEALITVCATAVHKALRKVNVDTNKENDHAFGDQESFTRL